MEFIDIFIGFIVFVLVILIMAKKVAPFAVLQITFYVVIIGATMHKLRSNILNTSKCQIPHALIPHNINEYKEFSPQEEFLSDASLDTIYPENKFDKYEGFFITNDDNKYNYDMDYKLSKKAQNIAQKAKESIKIRSKLTADSFKKYYQEELDGYENREWWERDQVDAGLDNNNHPTYSYF